MGESMNIINLIKNQKGLSLVELLVGMAILSIVLAFGFLFYSFGVETFSKGGKNSDSRQNIRLAANFITQELRYATHVELLDEIPSTFLTDYNYIYVDDVKDEDGNVIYRALHYKKANTVEIGYVYFDSIAQGVVLEDVFFALNLDEDKGFLEFAISSNEENFSIKSKISFLNYPLKQPKHPLDELVKLTGIVVKYKAEECPLPSLYSLTLAVFPEEGGTAVDNTGSNGYTAGTKIMITAIPNSGYSFNGWTSPAGTFTDATAASTTFIMPEQSVTITANFISDQSENDYGNRPEDYVLYCGEGKFSMPSSGKIDGSIYGKNIEIKSSSVEITGNIVSLTSVDLRSATTVGGDICALSGDVTLFSSNTLVKGNINASGNVILQSGTTVLGDVFAGGNVELKSSNARVLGNIHAGGKVEIHSGCTVGKNVFAGTNVSLYNSQSKDQGVQGDVHAGQNIFMENNTNISGQSWAGGGINHHNPNKIHQPVPPRIKPSAPSVCIKEPIPPPRMQSFAAGKEDIVVPQFDTIIIEPGEYGRLQFSDKSTVTLKGGVYKFSEINGANSQLTLRLDLSNGKDIKVFTVGNVRYTGPIEVSVDGSTWLRISELDTSTAEMLARKVYWENHGNFTITTNNSIRQWFGTVLSKNNITLNSSFYGIGAYATVEGTFDIKSSNPNITYIIADFARENW